MLSWTDIKNLQDKYDVKASKRFGQNFLIDKNVLKKIIETANIENKEVIEIGPGLGSLTIPLLDKVSKLTSYEIDEDMIKVIKGEINNDKFTLVEGDFLKQDIDLNSGVNVVANIPYNITSDILFKLFEEHNKIEKATLMVQKEVAMRLTSKVGTKNYGKLALTANYFGKVNYEFTVPSNAFSPAPKVDSAIITIEFNKFETDDNFTEFIKKSFAMRRKTLFNNLRQFMDDELAKKKIIKLNLKETVRPQELSLDDFIDLYKA